MDLYNSKNRPFAVIYFPEENSTAVVPVSWLTLTDKDSNTYMCKWPKSNLDAKAAAETKPRKSWKSYVAKVRHFSKTYDSGQKYMAQYEYDSDPNFITSASGDDTYLPRNNSPHISTPVSPSVSSATRPVTTKDTNRLEAKVDCLLRKMTAMEAELTAIKTKMSTLKSLDNFISMDLRVDDFQILKTLQDVEHFEIKLTAEEEFSKAVKRCGCLGGKDMKEAVRRILSMIFSHDLALTLCWHKGSNKTSIQMFPNILQFITVSLRANQMYSSTPQKEVEDVVKRWLRYACDRNGGRMGRMKKQLINVPSEENVPNINEEHC